MNAWFTCGFVFRRPVHFWLRFIFESLNIILQRYLSETKILPLTQHYFLFSLFFRTRPKVQFNGYVGHESSNGQASFENPMYDTNMKPTEAKAVRFDTTLNTVCTVV